MKVISILILLLIPLSASAKDCFLYPPCAKRLNVEELTGVITADFPGSEVEFYDCEGWSFFPYAEPYPDHLRPQDIPADLTLPYDTPRAFALRNLPEGQNCAALNGLYLTPHDPAETDREKRDRLTLEKEDLELRTREVIIEILERLDALEVTP